MPDVFLIILALMLVIIVLLIVGLVLVCAVGVVIDMVRKPTPISLPADGGILCAVLSVKEQRNLKQKGWIDVPSPSMPWRVYRIFARDWRTEIYESGICKGTVCIVFRDRTLPRADVIVMQKLMIEGDEKTYIDTAGIW